MCGNQRPWWKESACRVLWSLLGEIQERRKEAFGGNVSTLWVSLCFCDIHTAPCRRVLSHLTTLQNRPSQGDSKNVSSQWQWLSASTASPDSDSEWVVQGQWEQSSPLFSWCSVMPGAWLTETLVSAALTPLSVLCSSLPALQSWAQCLAPGGTSIHPCWIEMGPSWLVLIAFPLGVGASQRAFHEAIDRPESVLSTSSDISSLDPAPCQSAHLHCHWHKGQSPGLGGEGRGPGWVW